MIATQYNVPIMNALLKRGINIEARDLKGNTALLIVLEAMKNTTHPHELSAETLMAAGANIYVRNKKRESGESVGRYVNWRGLADAPQLKAYYQTFAANGTPPASASDVYKLLSVTPLWDAYAPVDYSEHLQRIFSHAKWESKEQAEGILEQIHKDGRITADTAESILAATFPQTRTHSMLQARDGRGR
jgi:hypothetical protein